MGREPHAAAERARARGRLRPRPRPLRRRGGLAAAPARRRRADPLRGRRRASTTAARARTRAIGGLSRAAYGRGRNSRRYDARKGVAPPVAAELRTLAGCVWHIFRRRCGNGIVLSALTLGRLREALRPAEGPGQHARPGLPERALGDARAARAARGAAARRAGRTWARRATRRRLREGGALPAGAAGARAVGRAAGARARGGGDRARARGLAPRRAAADRPARGGRREVGEPQRRADRAPAARLPLAADHRRRRRAPPRLPRRLHLAGRAPRLPARPARARVRLARRPGRSRGGGRG